MRSLFPRLFLLSVVWMLSAQALRAQAIAPPVLQLQAGPSATEFELWVTSDTANTVIHYTTDGREPGLTDLTVPASGIVEIDRNVTFKAKAWNATNPASQPPSTTTTAVYNAFGRIASGTAETFALTFDGRISGSGANYNGSFGDGTTDLRNAPLFTTDPAVFYNVVAVDGSASTSSTTDFTLVAKADGTVWSWGGNSSGQLGQGTTSGAVTSPAQVLKGAAQPLIQIISVAAATNSAYALDAEGNVWAWGSNAYGQLGDNTTTAHSYAAQVKSGVNTPLSGIIAISAGGYHLLALDQDGCVWAVGRGTENQLGKNAATNSLLAAKVLASTTAGDYLAGVKSVAAMGNSSLVVRSDGSVWGWGANTNGRLGDGFATTRNLPVKMKADGTTDFADAMAVAGGTSHTLILKNDHTVWAVGNNTAGVLGDGTTSAQSYPVQVKTGANTYLGNIVEIAAGPVHSIALDSAGNIYSWGTPGEGRLGANNPTSTNSYATNYGAWPNPQYVATDVSLSLSSTPGTAVYLLTLTPLNAASDIAWIDVYRGDVLSQSLTSAPPWQVSMTNPSPGEPPSALAYNHNGTAGHQAFLLNDADGDWMDDDWEQRSGLNPLSLNNPNVNSDGDDATNLQESLANTSPSDPAPVLTLTGPVGASLVP